MNKRGEIHKGLVGRGVVAEGRRGKRPQKKAPEVEAGPAVPLTEQEREQALKEIGAAIDSSKFGSDLPNLVSVLQRHQKYLDPEKHLVALEDIFSKLTGMVRQIKIGKRGEAPEFLYYPGERELLTIVQDLRSRITPERLEILRKEWAMEQRRKDQTRLEAELEEEKARRRRLEKIQAAALKPRGETPPVATPLEAVSPPPRGPAETQLAELPLKAEQAPMEINRALTAIEQAIKEGRLSDIVEPVNALLRYRKYIDRVFFLPRLKKIDQQLKEKFSLPSQGGRGMFPVGRLKQAIDIIGQLVAEGEAPPPKKGLRGWLKRLFGS